MTCVPEPLLYSLLVAAIGRSLAKNGGLKAIWGKNQDPGSSLNSRERQNDDREHQ